MNPAGKFSAPAELCLLVSVIPRIALPLRHLRPQLYPNDHDSRLSATHNRCSIATVETSCDKTAYGSNNCVKCFSCCRPSCCVDAACMDLGCAVTGMLSLRF